MTASASPVRSDSDSGSEIVLYIGGASSSSSWQIAHFSPGGERQASRAVLIVRVLGLTDMVV
jgi:hypothetical protein